MPMEDIKSSISQTGNMAKFTVKRYPVDSNADRIKATFEEVNTEDLINTLRTIRQLNMLNVMGRSLNLEGPAHTKIELTSSNEQFLRIVPPFL